LNPSEVTIFTQKPLAIILLGAFFIQGIPKLNNSETYPFKIE